MDFMRPGHTLRRNMDIKRPLELLTAAPGLDSPAVCVRCGLNGERPPPTGQDIAPVQWRRREGVYRDALGPMLALAMSEAWSLHPQLEHDTVPVGDLALSRVLAMNVADYPWLILVPRRLKDDPEQRHPVIGKDHASAIITEIADLAAADAARLMEEIALASRVLREVTACDNLNLAAIGNVVPQLHVHIVARRKTDPLWPKPVFGHAPMRAGETEEFGRFVEAVRRRLTP